MDGLTSIDSVYIATLFIVPGFVILTVRNQFVAGQSRQRSDQIIRLLTISALNFALTGWLIYVAIAEDASATVRVLLWTVVVLVAPSFFGVIWGISSAKGLSRRIWHRFGLNPLHVVPGAWDYKFAQSTGEWVLVTLKDGTKFGGWWAGSSFASSDPQERDLLIEQVYDLPDDESPWRATKKSVLICAGEVRSVEFIPGS